MPLAAVRLPAFTVVLVTSCLALGCGGSPTGPDPVYDMKSETFSGSLNTGGGASFPFVVVNPGSIDVSITQLSPVSTLSMGLSLGSWDAATEACTQQVTTSGATLNTVYSASPNGPGNYCVSIFDSGNVQAEIGFTLSVTHY